MMKFTFLAALFFLLSINLFGQTPTPTPPDKTDNDDTVKISTTLIRVDVSVTDKKGRQVTGLKPEDFEILENGKPQTITTFSYVAAASQTTENSGQSTTKTNSKDKKDKTTEIIPQSDPRPEEVQRTIALVVDDLGLSFRAIASARTALKKFVDEQMQPNDLVSIIRTSTGGGVLQQFTSDKRILYTAIERIRWFAGGKGNIDAFKAADPDGSTSPAYDKLREDMLTIGTLGTVNYVVNGMSEMPGRKAILLFSEGFSLYDSSKTDNSGELQDVSVNSGTNPRLRNSIGRLIESANRASVVIYGVDARGVVSNMPESYDASAGTNAGGKFGMGRGVSSTTIVDDRTKILFETQRGLKYLSEQTGGFAVINNNNLSNGVEKVLNDQSGYYLIGYQPNEETFDTKTSRYNKFKVKVKDSDLQVRYRSGFFGVEDKKSAAINQTPAQKIASALVSPFKSSDIDLSLNTILISDSNNASLIRSIINIDVKDLKFTTEPDGRRKAEINIVAVTFGDNSTPVEQFAKTYTILVPEEKYQNILKTGLVYDLPVPIKKTGIYQFRIAVRDASTNKIGSASNLVQVPNLTKDFALSGIVLENTTGKNSQKSSVKSDKQPDLSDVYLNMSLRKFKRQTDLRYGYLIYNPKLDAKQKPQLQVQTKLFSQGKVVFETNPVMINIEGQNDLQHIENIGSLTLGDNLPAGEYVLQIIVKDTLSKDKKQTISQWIDFEITD